jgi:hypothetical protein
VTPDINEKELQNEINLSGSKLHRQPGFFGRPKNLLSK